MIELLFFFVCKKNFVHRGQKN